MNGTVERRTGSQPSIGSFEYRFTGGEYCIVILKLDGQRLERYTNSLQGVYKALRKEGFTMSGM